VVETAAEFFKKRAGKPPSGACEVSSQRTDVPPSPKMLFVTGGQSGDDLGSSDGEVYTQKTVSSSLRAKRNERDF